MRRRRRRKAGIRLTVVGASCVAVGVALYMLPSQAPLPPVSSPRETGAATGPQLQAARPGGTSSTTALEVSQAANGGLEQAPWVEAENAKPGNADWRITTPQHGTMAGFADHTSAVLGDTIGLYVTTDAPSFVVRAYRMGYYGGADARLVWTSGEQPGVMQPPCAVDHGTNMVSCDAWSKSLSVSVNSAFVPGDYLLELVGSAGQESYVPLTVTDPASHAAYLVMNDIYTWQAWNPYGGYDLYQGLGQCVPTYPVCNRARVLSFDRPYGYGQGAGDFLGNELPLVSFMEQHGLDVTYATSADIEASPAMLLQHSALLSLGHDECWSYQERLASLKAEQAGVNMIFFGASAQLRHVRLRASPLGPMREEVDYRDSGSDPLDGTGAPMEVTGNTWADAPSGWSEVPFVGEEYSGYVRPGEAAVAFVVGDSSSWLFTGTGLRSGQAIPGLLASDFDQVQPGVSPANEQIMAHSPMPLDEVQTNVGRPASDTAYHTDPTSGAGVFDTGTCMWIPDLYSSSYLDQMTANLLSVFGQGPVGRTHPSIGNESSYY
jgi:hypothetical protein